MTAGCTGAGTSSARVGFGATVSITASEIGGYLSTLSWGAPLAVLAGYLGLITYELSTFCTTDPPAMPSDSAINAAMIDLLGDPVSRQQGLLTIQQALGAAFWPVFCKCDSGTVTPYTPPSLTGPQVNPVGVPVQLTQSCFTGIHGVAFMNLAPPAYNITPLPNGTNGFINPTSIQWTFACVNHGAGPHFGAVFTIHWVDGSFGADIRTDTYQVFASSSITVVASIPVGAAFASVVQTKGGTSADEMNIDYQYFCNGDRPGAMPAGCCPPDPVMSMTLQSILDSVTLLQRQLAPFASVHGGLHSVLSGTGTVSVQGLLGVSVIVTTLPSRLGSSVGDPNEIFDAGWINWGTADGFRGREWVSNNPYLSFPPEAGQYTVIGYSLSPGVVVDIQEVVREP